jgi:AcrR family transcriptional regulator
MARDRQLNAARRSPGRPRSAEADRAILEAALDLFVKRGFDRVSIDDIAEQAGVARTTVYRRWTSKAALIAEAIASERGAPELDSSGARGSTEGLLDSLGKALSAPHMKSIIARLIGAGVDHPELMAAYWRTYMEPRREAALRLLEVERAGGRLPRDADLPTILDIVSGVFAYQVLVRPGERTGDELKAHLLAALHALGAAPPWETTAPSPREAP